MQSDDSSLPVVSTYLPATQSMQLSWDELATMNENLPARHAMQWLLPVTSVYVPAAQSTQSLVDKLKNLPSLQAVQLVPPSATAPLPTPASTTEPEAQCPHATLPLASANVPAGQ